MEWIVWTGAGMTLVGCALLVVSVILIARAKQQATDDDDLRMRLGRIIPVNLGGLAVAVLGLMTVVVGIMVT